jgi:carboxynorspermidine decarboxylase
MKTPAFIVDEERIRANCEILAAVKERTGCKILLALKGFAMWPLFPIIREYLDGVCASSPWEARLGREEFGGEVHAYAAAYSEADFAELLALCDTIDFNSFSQLDEFRELVGQLPPAGAPGENTRPARFGLRINPECSTQNPAHAIYDPCAPRSRLGIRKADFDQHCRAEMVEDLSAAVGREAGLNTCKPTLSAFPALQGISGLHFHTLCEQNADDLETTLKAVEQQFGEILPQMEWINFGGGHHITRSDYDIDQLCRLIDAWQKRYDIQVILEPGEAVALNAGVLVTTVLDVIDNDGPVAVLDASCTCHMPDVLEMPYRPVAAKLPDADFFSALDHPAGAAGEKPYTYRLTGLSCLAGDVIGDYSFDEPLVAGDRLVFGDMAHYTMVKTTFFNGIRHPDIAILRNGQVELIRRFDYSDYKGRLA